MNNHMCSTHGGGVTRKRCVPQSLWEPVSGLGWAGDPGTCIETARQPLSDVCLCTAQRGQQDQRSIAGNRDQDVNPAGALEGKGCWKGIGAST